MSDVPYLTADQMREVDRAMEEDYCIGLIQMMENAGRNFAHLARLRSLEGDPRSKPVVLLGRILKPKGFVRSGASLLYLDFRPVSLTGQSESSGGVWHGRSPFRLRCVDGAIRLAEVIFQR